MKILVTGASGFVGSHLTERLISEGHEVIATSMGGENRLPKGVSKILYYSLEGIDWYYIGSVDAIFHLAANTDTLCCDYTEMMRANYYGPIKLFRSIGWNCKKIIYASSTAVYGDAPVPYVEDVTPLRPLNIYADSKVQFDQFAMNFAEERQFPEERQITIVGLRYCNIYGPGESHKGYSASVVGQMLRTMSNGKKFTLFNDGEQRRDWVHVQDVVEANMQALNYQGPSDIFNIGSGQSVSFNEAAKIICNLLSNDGSLMPDYKDCDFTERYQSHTLCSIEKARAQLGYSPIFDLRSGLEDYIRASGAR